MPGVQYFTDFTTIPPEFCPAMLGTIERSDTRTEMRDLLEQDQSLTPDAHQESIWFKGRLACAFGDQVLAAHPQVTHTFSEGEVKFVRSIIDWGRKRFSNTGRFWDQVEEKIGKGSNSVSLDLAAMSTAAPSRTQLKSSLQALMNPSQPILNASAN